MNKQDKGNGKRGIEWCDYTFNPVAGCFHACQWSMPDGTIAKCCICGRKISFDPRVESNWTRLSDGDKPDGPAVYICDLDLAKIDPSSRKYQKNLTKAFDKLAEMLK